MLRLSEKARLVLTEAEQKEAQDWLDSIAPMLEPVIEKVLKMNVIVWHGSGYFAATVKGKSVCSHPFPNGRHYKDEHTVKRLVRRQRNANR